jgi:predicted transcriptional regulator of viral defense system
MPSTADKILDVAKKRRIVRPRDLEPLGIARVQLTRLCRAGKLQRISRGVYALPDQSVTEHHSLAVVAKQIPHAVICLLSALRFHDLTTQAPHEVWAAIDRKARMPKLTSPPIRIFRFSGRALEEGVDRREIEGVQVAVYSVAKTVADCFKYRNKIGLDVAIEALRDALRSRSATVDEIYGFAKICRVANVMRPYLEAVV